MMNVAIKPITRFRKWAAAAYGVGRYVVSLIPVLIIVSTLSYLAYCYFFSSKGPDSIILLVTDSLLFDDPRVKVWQSAAAEEGLHLTLMTDSDFMRPCNNLQQYAGLIVPDQIHKIASDMLIDGIKNYVREGGNLLLVYDAGIWNTLGVYPTARHRLSELVGVDYALYKSMLANSIVWESVTGKAASFSSLVIPPGKYVQQQPEQTQQSEKLVSLADKSYQLTTYGYEMLRYPSFVTRGAYAGETLLTQSNGNLFAGQRRYGKGSVLFVNTPLGYMKGETDGMLLHGFIRYFADNILQLPYLASVPDGMGGLVMNLHLDSSVELQPLAKMQELGFYQQGPYSIHITAGPGKLTADDRQGLDVSTNQQIRQWIEFFRQRNHVIGSHGGWLHDYFANRISADRQEEFVSLLALNKQALEEVTGVPVREYSAPKGNHPQWVSEWLEQQDMLAYYFTGNSGMGPTRVYRDGMLRQEKLWAFPIQNYRNMTGFDELKFGKVTDQQVKNWLLEMTDFSVRNRTSRLIYFHPRGVIHYPQAAKSWLAYTAEKIESNQFRWYTMSGLAEFLNARDQVHWQVKQKNRSHMFSASHPSGALAQQTWVLPRSKYKKPEITQGRARLGKDSSRWLVIAESGTSLEFVAERIEQ